MTVGDSSRLSRRGFLRAVGVSCAAGYATHPVSASHGSVTMNVEDQTSDEDTLVIASGRFDTDVRLVVRLGSGLKSTHTISSGTTYSSRTIDLEHTIGDAQVVNLRVYESETDRLLDWDAALVSVDEPITDVGINDVLDDEYELVQSDSEAGFHYPYYLYSPGPMEDSTQPLIVQGNNSPLPKDGARNHVLYAKSMVEGLVDRFAEEFRVPALVPTFPRLQRDPPPSTRSHLNVQSLTDRALRTDHRTLARVDRQLMRMVDDAQNRLRSAGYTPTEQVHMHGFSTSGRFAPRIAMLHPERVSAVSAGGNGMYTLPTAEFSGQSLPYPVGVADLESLVGAEFNLDEWRTVPHYFYLGDNDTSDSLRRLRENLRELVNDIYPPAVTDRFELVESVHDTVGASATFEVYEGVGHRTSSQQVQDLREFHWEHMNVEHSRRESMVKDLAPLAVALGAAAGGAVGLAYGLPRLLDSDSNE